MARKATLASNFIGYQVWVGANLCVGAFVGRLSSHQHLGRRALSVMVMTWRAKIQTWASARAKNRPVLGLGGGNARGPRVRGRYMAEG